MTEDQQRQNELQSMAESLIELRDDELLEVLRMTFAQKVPAPEESAWLRSQYFLGIAYSDLADESDPEAGKSIWRDWQTAAAAYLDVEEYGTWRGPDYGFANEGRCQTCQVIVCGLLKHGICPVCGSRVNMT